MTAVIAPSLAALLLRDLAAAATPGPWDAFGSHVASLSMAVDPNASEYSRDSQDDHDFYGGSLVCETCWSHDARFIAAARAFAPVLADAYLDVTKRLANACMQLRLVRAELADERHLTALIRSERYQRPAFAVARQLAIQESIGR